MVIGRSMATTACGIDTRCARTEAYGPLLCEYKIADTFLMCPLFLFHIIFYADVIAAS